MSNAAVVTQALFGGGHSTALLLTTGGLLSCSDLFGRAVINAFDLFLLSSLEGFSFQINAGDAALPGLVACKTHPAWPTTGAFKHSDLRMLTHGGVQVRPRAREGWKNPAQARAQQMNERIACSTSCHPSSQTFFFLHGGALRDTAALKDEPESWHINTAEASAH